MSARYWETEKPLEADTGRNILRLFKDAGKLQVSMPYWKNKDGDQKNGKTVTLDVAALIECPAAVEMLKQVLG